MQLVFIRSVYYFGKNHRVHKMRIYKIIAKNLKPRKHKKRGDIASPRSAVFRMIYGLRKTQARLLALPTMKVVPVLIKHVLTSLVVCPLSETIRVKNKKDFIKLRGKVSLQEAPTGRGTGRSCNQQKKCPRHFFDKQRREQKFPPTLSPGLNTARMNSSFLLPLLAMEVVFVLLRTLTTSAFSISIGKAFTQVKLSIKTLQNI